MREIPITWAYRRGICQIAFPPNRSPRIRSAFTARNTWSRATPAADVHASIANFTQRGIGTVRTRPCLPNRSTMHQRPSNCRRCAKVRAAASDRRRPHPMRTASMARSRRSLRVVTSGALRSTAPAVTRASCRHGRLSISLLLLGECPPSIPGPTIRCHWPRPLTCESPRGEY